MIELCVVEGCFAEGFEKIIVNFDRQDSVFELMLCTDHGEGFRGAAGEYGNEVGAGVTMFSADLID